MALVVVGQFGFAFVVCLVGLDALGFGWCLVLIFKMGKALT